MKASLTAFLSIIALFFLVSPCKATASDVKIGVILPFTGSANAKQWGDMLKKSILIAADDINSHGKLLDKKIEVICEDSTSDVQQAIAAANKLANQDNVTMIFSALSNYLDPLEFLKNNNLIHMTLKYEYEYHENDNPYSFQIGIDDDPLPLINAATGIARYSNIFSGKDIIIAMSSHIAPSYLEKLTSDFTNQKIQNKIISAASDNKYTFSGVKPGNYIAINLTGSWNTYNLIRQARQDGIDLEVLQHSASPAIIYSKEAKELVQKIMSALPQPTTGGPRQLSDDEILMCLQAHAAIQAWANAVRKSGSVDAAKVAKELQKMSFNTIVGEIRPNPLCKRCLQSGSSETLCSDKCSKSCLDGCKQEKNLYCCTIKK